MLTVMKESICSLLNAILPGSEQSYPEYNHSHYLLYNNSNNNINDSESSITNEQSHDSTYIRFPELSRSDTIINDENTPLLDNTKTDKFFKHLVFANQSYFEHFRDAMYYSWLSYKSSIYFFIHAFWPDILQFDGSHTVFKLRDILIEKYNKNIIKNVSTNNIS